jgi:hypothetical protein
MLSIVMAAVAQVDTTDERNVVLGMIWVAEYDELLMVWTAGSDSHVQQAFATCGCNVLPKVAILLLTELKAVEMRPPEQAPDINTSATRIREDRRYLRPDAIKALIWIATPVSEEQ